MIVYRHGRVCLLYAGWFCLQLVRTFVLRRGRTGRHPESVYRLPKFSGDFLVQLYVFGEIFMKIRSLFAEI